MAAWGRLVDDILGARIFFNVPLQDQRHHATLRDMFQAAQEGDDRAMRASQQLLGWALDRYEDPRAELRSIQFERTGRIDYALTYFGLGGLLPHEFSERDQRNIYWSAAHTAIVTSVLLRHAYASAEWDVFTKALDELAEHLQPGNDSAFGVKMLCLVLGEFDITEMPDEAVIHALDVLGRLFLATDSRYEITRVGAFVFQISAFFDRVRIAEISVPRPRILEHYIQSAARRVIEENAPHLSIESYVLRRGDEAIDEFAARGGRFSSHGVEFALSALQHAQDEAGVNRANALLDRVLLDAPDPFAPALANSAFMQAMDMADPAIARRIYDAADAHQEDMNGFVANLGQITANAISSSENPLLDNRFANYTRLGAPYRGIPNMDFLQSRSRRFPNSHAVLSEPWTLARHSAMGPDAAAVVMTVLLCAGRLQPQLPIELWLVIFEFMIRADFRGA